MFRIRLKSPSGGYMKISNEKALGKLLNIAVETKEMPASMECIVKLFIKTLLSKDLRISEP